MTDYRPNPDDLLSGIKKAADKTARGKLKVFFGMCPGVGKTFSMLRAAQEKKKAGVNVVVGYIETHKRSETEKLLEGLEIIPRKKIEHKGTWVEEFDLDQAIKQKPALILVDELAHTNAPGSKHTKRYQDIKDLLFAGIDVYTTMNVQHVESRADLVYQIAGAPVRETVPDAFLEYADQIELIDLAPEDLIRRLRDGKVYLGERAERAAENFFREEKLTALRELALRFTAEVVDDQLRDQMQEKRIQGPWNTNERLMVAVSHSPLSARLIRATRRMAFNLEAPWVALYVDTGFELAPDDHERLTKHLNLARELGAEVVTTKDRSISDALMRVAGERNVTQIVMGRPDRRFLRDLFGRGNILDQLVNETSEVDIHVIRQKRKPIYRGFHISLPKFDSEPGVYLKTLIYLLALSIFGYLIKQYVGYRAVGFGFLLGMLPISTLGGRGPIILASGLTALIWNFFFIPPEFTFHISETEDFMMILAYFGVASVAGFLTSRIKQQENDLRQRERRANILYSFSKKLSELNSNEAIATLSAESIESLFPSRVIIYKSESPNELSFVPLNRATQAAISDKDRAVAVWSFDNRKKAGWKTDTLSSSECLCIPLLGRSSAIGILMLYPVEKKSMTLDQENLIETISGHLSSALEKEILESKSRRTEIYEKSEQLHQALLNTVSHELRTPLTSILGGVTSLKDPKTIQNDSLRRQITDDVVDSAERLAHTIENLMDMSRISSGALKLNEQVFELNDFIESTSKRFSKLLQHHTLKLEFSRENLFIRGDEKFLEHLLHNLLSNAVQYSPRGSLIIIQSRKNQSYAEFSVTDEGKGIPEADLTKVFDRFYRAPGSPPGGVGLGLSITKAIAEAHGGGIFASNRSDRNGAVFTVIIPAQEVPREVFQ